MFNGGSSSEGLKITFESKPRVLILPTAFQKLTAYIELCPDEISGLGVVEIIGDLTFLIKDVFILKQKVSGADTKIDRNALAEFTLDCVKKGTNLSQFKLWWHSHVNMGTFWSGTDWDTARGFDNGRIDWMLSIVGNKRNDFRARLDLYKPPKMTIDNIPIDNLSFLLSFSKDDAISKECAAEIEAKVQKSATAFLWGFLRERLMGGKEKDEQ